MLAFFKLILYTPLLNTLIFFYHRTAFQDLGVAIIELTLLIRIILYPLFYKSFFNQTVIQRLQPHISKIQNDHKHDREKQAQALMTLYREHRVNPFTSFALLVVQLPVLIALYQVFLYPPPELSTNFIHLIDLSKPAILLVVLAVAAQYFQGKLLIPRRPDGTGAATEAVTDQAAKMARQMVVIGPLLTLFILWHLPAAVSLYWLVSSLFSIGQQWYINKKIHGSAQAHH